MVVVLPPPDTNLISKVDDKTERMSFVWYSFFQRKFLLPFLGNDAVAFANITKNTVEGLLIPVSDSTTNVLGKIITGGGTNHVLGYYNGTNWIVAAAAFTAAPFNSPVAFASLPAAPLEGMLYPITDSTVNTWGSIIAGGSTNHVLGYYNGTNWTVAAK